MECHHKPIVKYRKTNIMTESIYKYNYKCKKCSTSIEVNNPKKAFVINVVLFLLIYSLSLVIIEDFIDYIVIISNSAFLNAVFEIPPTTILKYKTIKSVIRILYFCLCWIVGDIISKWIVVHLFKWKDVNISENIIKNEETKKW